MSTTLLISQPCSDQGIDVTVNFTFENIPNATMGSLECVTLFVDGHDEILFSTFGITWNPTVLSYVSGSAVGLPSVPAFTGLSVNDTGTAFGNLGVIMDTTDPNTGAGSTFPDNFEYFVLCFDVIGDPGECTQLLFTDNINTLGDPEIIYTPADDLTVTCEASYTFSGNTSVCVGCNDLFISAGSCPSQVGMNNGSITFSACGGTPNYFYDVNTLTGPPLMEDEQVTIDNLAPGVYTILVEDSSVPSSTSSINITVGTGAAMNASLNVINPECYEDPDDGEIQITGLTGGAPPYEYAWSSFEFGTNNIDDLTPGEYTVTISDLNGCELILTDNIVADTIFVTAELVQAASCAGVNDAIVIIRATGGNPIGGNMYEFNGNAASDSLIITGIPGGSTLAYNAEDDNNCVSATGFINIPIISSPVANLVQEDVSCIGANDGTIFATLDNSNAMNFFPEMFAPDGSSFSGGIQGGNPFAYQADNLEPGKYRLVLTERILDPVTGIVSSGCIVDTCFTIEEPLPLELELDLTLTSNPSCVGNDGKITVTSMGGTAPYTYEWMGSTATDPTLCDLGAGTYMVTVTDANNCTDTLSHEITDSGNMLDIDALVLGTVSCPSTEDGMLQVIVNTGGGPFNYNWAQATGPTLSTTFQLNNVGPGEYFVTVSDPVNSCMAVDSVTLFPATAIDVSAMITPPSCDSIANGIISIIENNGATPFTYQWGDVDNTMTPLLSSQTAGTYNVTITDTNMCTLDTFFVLQGPPPVIQTITQINPTLCNGESSGSITIVASGGNGSTMFNFVVTDMNGMLIYNQTSTSPHDITGLPSGELTITTSDLVCPSVPEIIVIADATQIELIVSMSDIINPSCFGDCDGSATVSATGGTSGYTYTWTNDGTTGSTNNNLCAGMQYVSILDANNCAHLDSFEITQPDSLVALINPFLTQDIACESDDTGVIAIDATGGNETGYTYDWMPNVSNNNLASNLGVGTYTVTVSDAQGCSDTVSYALDTAPPVTATVPTPLIPECFGGSTCISVDDIMGGVGGPYVFSINNGLNIPIDSCVEVISGPYTIRVFDSAGCEFDTMIFVEQPMELIAEIGPDEVVIPLGDSTVMITVQVTNEFPIDTIIWTPSNNIECQDPLCQTIAVFPTVSTTYTATVFDINGCSAEDNVDVVLDDTRLVYVPNSFSPNNDGVNDVFMVFVGQGVRQIESFRIYDRWGNLIHEELGIDTEDPQSLIGWDGTFKGQDLDPGVFTYHVQASFVDDRVIDFTGTMTLFR